MKSPAYLLSAMILALSPLPVARAAVPQETVAAEAALQSAKGALRTKEDLAKLDLGALESFGASVEKKLEELDKKIAEAEEVLKGAAEGADKEKAQKALDQLKTELEQWTTNLRNLLPALAAKDSSKTSEFRALLQARTGEVDSITDIGAQLTFVQKQLDKLWAWVLEEGPGLLGKIIGFLIILLAFRYLARFTGKIVGRALSTSRLNMTDLLKNFFIGTTRKLVFLVGIVIALGSLGVDVGPVLAALGIGGFILGFALQETLSNFAAGLMIMLYRPYDVGDFIKAAGVMGSVESMTLVSTIIKTGDNQREIVPNGKIWGDVITNVTANPTRRVDMTAGIGYDDDIEKARAILEDILASHELVLADPAPVVQLHELADSSVNFIVRPWAKTSDYWSVYWDVTKAIKTRFDAEGISIPYPQQDVHLHGLEAAKA